MLSPYPYATVWTMYGRWIATPRLSATPPGPGGSTSSTRDFRLEDVWALPTPGGPDDFPRLVERIAARRPARRAPRALARALFAIRWKLGELLGWDERRRASARGCRRCATGCRPTCATRPPARTSTRCPFNPLYLLDDEWAAEIANRTMHGVMHLGWVPDGAGGYRGQMAVLVKPNGLLGAAYMAAIRPFRHLIVYPPMLRQIGREWPDVARGSHPATA